MQAFLKDFYNILSAWRGSLVKVGYLKERNAKEYLHQLARAGKIEKVCWGWYWIPGPVAHFGDFLKKDKNFKVVAGQTAASFWNNDFIHRDVYRIKVKDPSFGKALEAFAASRKWSVVVEPLQEDKTQYVLKDRLYIQTLEDTVLECMQSWAFTDAFAVIYAHPSALLFEAISRKGYWMRIAKTPVRVRTALHYGCALLNEQSQSVRFPVKKTRLDDAFLRSEIEEAITKVVDHG